jgi:glycosyltransferase involved in cell wall biosynthesis
MLALIYGFYQLKEFETNHQFAKTGFSLIIPFRNEAENLPQLISSIKALEYPTHQFEVLFVDDDSEDDSVESINIHLKDSQIQYRILKNLRSSNSPKKDAIKTAIHESKFEWILTTDADCILPIQWLSTYDRFIHEQHSEMLAGPVSYASVDYSFVEHFQISEFLSLQGATVGGFGIGKPFLCNGANLAYKKDTFLTLNGFEGNDQIASGDDVFLFEKFVETYPNKVHFLKSTSALVTTLPLKSWTEVIQQKTRWAAKSSSYNLWFTKLVGLIVVLMNLSMIVSLFLFLWDRKNFLTFLIVCLLKVGVDDHLITLTSHFYRGKEKKLRDVGFSSILYPFFSTYVAFRSVFVKYTWKGRKFKK